MTSPLPEEVQYCNWSFDECLVPSEKWLVSRDCDDKIQLRRYGGKNWDAYKASLEPRQQFTPPSISSKCPKCKKYINGVNPYDDGETWRM